MHMSSVSACRLRSLLQAWALQQRCKCPAPLSHAFCSKAAAPAAQQPASAASEDRKTADDSGQNANASAKRPPENWYKRGTWVDPAQIVQRMDDADEPAKAVHKEPETAVSRSLSTMIKVRVPHMRLIGVGMLHLCLPWRPAAL